MTEPAYQSRWSTVWCADALDIMPTIETESMDLILTDPPYGVEWRSGFRAETFDAIKNDGAGDRDVVRAVLTQCVRVVDQARHLYVFGPPDALEWLKVSEATTLIWDKGVIGAGDLSSSWGPMHEEITFVVTKHRHAGQKGGGNLAVRRRKGTVLRFGRPTGRKVRHPSEKPVALLTELIESSSRVGEVVLDPFAGIGSTGVAAVLRGRRCILIEMDQRYVDIAIERLQVAEAIADQMEGA